jgi:hypothetical protein
MPNWCCNYLEVTGPKKALDAFKATINTKDHDGEVCEFSFSQTVPPPANMLRGDLTLEDEKRAREAGIPTWYEWQRENWGCKWDACEASVDVSEKEVCVNFDTPWGPPVAWMEKERSRVAVTMARRSSSLLTPLPIQRKELSTFGAFVWLL